MQGWLVWLLIAAALGAAELLSGTLDLVLLACAALIAGGTAALGLPVGLQFVAFCISAVLVIIVVRPIARRAITRGPVMRSGVAALVGREAVVLTEVDRQSGRVRIGGEEWTARPYDPDVVIPPGTYVDVFAIEGATALVHPREESWPS
jgi:membrane protein implicated in regulation of membrane protease activity